MDTFVARQPIFSNKKEIYAYELLFRSGLSNAFPDIDGAKATTSLLSSSFFTSGIDRISGGKLSFINFNEELLLSGYPEMFPSSKIVIEVLEDVAPDESIISAISGLTEKGYIVALDDFVYEEKFDKLIDFADIIKIDFLMLDNEQLRSMVAELKKFNCKLLAEKIETYEDFELASEMGFDYFQGYFFAKPEILQNKEISANSIALFRLLDEVNRESLDTAKVEELLQQDVSTSFKLLNFLNSAHFSRLQPVTSIRQAIAFLGAAGLQKFVSLVAIGQISSEKPNELIRTSILRARFLEQLGLHSKSNSGELFMLGLFSLIDAMLDRKMEEILQTIPLSDLVVAALGENRGAYYPYLELVQSYEAGHWEKFEQNLELLNISSDIVVDYYLDAVAWAESF